MLMPGPSSTATSAFHASFATALPNRSAAVTSHEQAKALAVG